MSTRCPAGYRRGIVALGRLTTLDKVCNDCTMTTTRATEVRKPGKQIQIVSGEYRGMIARTVGVINDTMINVFVFDNNQYVTVFVADVDVAETERTMAKPVPASVVIEGRCENCGNTVRATFDPTTGGMHRWYHSGDMGRGREVCP